MGGGAKKIEKAADDAFSDPIGTIINVGTQTMTGGLVGYDKDSGFSVGKGLTGNVAIDGLKEVTGAKAAEEANKMAREQFDQQKVDAEKARLEAQAQSSREQIAASRMASGRGGGGVGTGTSRVSRFSSLGEDERDFLGL